MFIVISPAKKLNFDFRAPVNKKTQLAFKRQAKKLIEVLRSKKPSEISKLMKLSDSLTKLNVQRYKQYSDVFDASNSKQALFAFAGDTYTGLDADSLSEQEVIYAQEHLGILSGLYGLIRPLDLIQPYRLEMGTKIGVGESKNLYEFWGELVTDKVNKYLNKDKPLVNLASQEYFQVIKRDKIEAPIITPVFKEKRNGEYKIISFSAKKARGMMARYILQNQLTKVEALKKFNLADYQFNVELSSKEGELVFSR